VHHLPVGRSPPPCRGAICLSQSVRHRWQGPVRWCRAHPRVWTAGPQSRAGARERVCCERERPISWSRCYATQVDTSLRVPHNQLVWPLTRSFFRTSWKSGFESRPTKGTNSSSFVRFGPFGGPLPCPTAGVMYPTTAGPSNSYNGSRQSYETRPNPSAWRHGVRARGFTAGQPALEPSSIRVHTVHDLELLPVLLRDTVEVVGERLGQGSGDVPAVTESRLRHIGPPSQRASSSTSRGSASSP
jgi:hypothetical protein